MRVSLGRIAKRRNAAKAGVEKQTTRAASQGKKRHPAPVTGWMLRQPRHAAT
jgi:hypothetical protein